MKNVFLSFYRNIAILCVKILCVNKALSEIVHQGAGLGAGESDTALLKLIESIELET